MMIQAGKLRLCGVVKERSTTLGTRGQPEDTWVDVLNIKHSMKMLSGGESDMEGLHHSTATYEIVCRYSSAIQPKHRIYTQGKILEIRLVDNIEMRNHALRIVASEVNP